MSSQETWNPITQRQTLKSAGSIDRQGTESDLQIPCYERCSKFSFKTDEMSIIIEEDTPFKQSNAKQKPEEKHILEQTSLMLSSVKATEKAADKVKSDQEAKATPATSQFEPLCPIDLKTGKRSPKQLSQKELVEKIQGIFSRKKTS